MANYNRQTKAQLIVRIRELEEQLRQQQQQPPVAGEEWRRKQERHQAVINQFGEPNIVELEERGRILSITDISAEQVHLHQEQMARIVAEGEDGYIVFRMTSNGGPLALILDLITWMRLRVPRERFPIVCEVVGWARSSATLLLAAADVRLAYADSSILIHAPKIHLYEDVYDARNFERLRQTVAPKEEAMLSVYLNNTRMSREMLQRIFAEADRDMSAQEALRVGIVDRVVD